MLFWVKTIVGALVAVNFVLPLYTVVSNRDLWDEPMVVLAGNLSGMRMLFGLTLMLIGVYDLAELNMDYMCGLLQHNMWALGVGLKMSGICMAVDQFVAVTRLLHHYDIMLSARPWLLAATWLTWAANFLAGIMANTFDLETYADQAAGDGNGSLVFPGCRRANIIPVRMIYAIELQLLIFSLVTAGLFIYTGVVGHRYAVQLARQLAEQQNRVSGDDDQKFSDNYRAFKKILIVLSLTVTLDIIGPIVRVININRWYPTQELTRFLNQARVFGSIFEGWAYGLLNAKLRAAYRRLLCGRSDGAGRPESVQAGGEGGGGEPAAEEEAGHD